MVGQAGALRSRPRKLRTRLMLYTYSQYGLAGLALILLVSAVFVRGKRGPLIWGAASATCAGARGGVVDSATRLSTQRLKLP